MKTTRRILGLNREDGATAVLVSLLTLFVLLPLVGVATSTFIRSGAVTELQLAADAGALAGAATIPLGDLRFATTYVESTANVPPIDDVEPPGNEVDPIEVGIDEEVNRAIDDAIASLTPGMADNPRDIACKQTLIALKNNGLLGEAFATSPLNLSAECIGGVFDTAGLKIRTAYLPDLAFLTEFGECLTTLAAGNDPTSLFGNLGHVLPALMRPGMRVNIERGVRPPLEVLTDPTKQASDLHLATAAARRRFKNAVVLPGQIQTASVPNPIPSPSPLPTPLPSPFPDPSPSPSPLPDPIVPATSTAIPLDPKELENRRDETLDTLEMIEEFLRDPTIDPPPMEVNGEIVDPEPVTIPIPSECTRIFSALRDDFVDVANPAEAEAVSVQEVLDEADRTKTAVLALTLPDPDDLAQTLVAGIPFFDFFPICVEKAGNDFVGINAAITGAGCAANAPGAFRAALVPS